MNVQPKIGVGAVVVGQDDKVLLVKRRFEPSAGYWSFPGGHVEPGETLEEAVLRELLEETGLVGHNPKLLAVTEYICLSPTGSLKYHYVIVDFLIRDFSGELRLNEESEDAGFFNIDEALSLKLSISTQKLLNLIRTKNDSLNLATIYHIVTRIKENEYDKVLRALSKSVSA